MTSAADAFASLRETDNFGLLVADVDEVFAEPIARYREALEPSRLETKATKDSVWGMIDLEPREVGVIDSPPFQRLRRVRQLGLTYLTYPTGGYSRFEHALGAVHQSQRMLRTIAARSEEALRADIEAAAARVRLAALVHDIGHMPLSHVSERYFVESECGDSSLLRHAQGIVGDITDLFGVPDPGLAECVSVSVLASDSFSELLAEIGYTRNDIATAALSIIGLPPSVRSAFVAQIVTNAIDADKLDYMFRDAWVTRVPVAVDLERLLYKLKVLERTAENLPEHLQQLARAREPVLLLGTDLAGDALSVDLAQARSMLFQRVYFHHKTRAAERLALRILDEIRMRPGQLLAYDDELFAQFGAERFPQIKPSVRMLLDRDLPRRCFALSLSFVLHEAGELTAEQGIREDQLTTVVSDAALRSELRDEIQERADEVARLLDMPGPSAVWVDTFPRPKGTGKNNLIVELPDGSVRSASNFAPESAVSTHDPSDMFFVYASGHRRSAVFVLIATELALADRFRLYFGRAAADHAKISIEGVEETKRSLEAADPSLFSAHGQLRPPSAFVASEAARPRLRALASRFAHFNVAGITIDDERIARFLNQFPERLVEPMLSVLEDALLFLPRAELGPQLVDVIADDVRKGAVCVPLTRDPGKSAKHLGYFLKDVRKAPPIVDDLERALAGDRPIVLFDDCMISGRQAVGVVRTWMGRGSRDTPRAKRLSEDQRRALASQLLGFRFVYAFKRGVESLTSELSGIGLEADVRAAVLDDEPDPLKVAGPHRDELREFLSTVGESLLLTTLHVRAETKSDWPAERCKTFALGWGGDERLVVMEYGVPTGTITALWKNGMFRNTEWLPLFQRRGDDPPEPPVERT